MLCAMRLGGTTCRQRVCTGHAAPCLEQQQQQQQQVPAPARRCASWRCSSAMVIYSCPLASTSGASLSSSSLQPKVLIGPPCRTSSRGRSARNTRPWKLQCLQCTVLLLCGEQKSLTRRLMARWRRRASPLTRTPALASGTCKPAPAASAAARPARPDTWRRSARSPCCLASLHAHTHLTHPMRCSLAELRGYPLPGLSAASWGDTIQ